MDKKNAETKGKKQIGKKAKKIKEKMMDKVEDRIENEQKTTKKVEEIIIRNGLKRDYYATTLFWQVAIFNK